jgi:hypothetical protein
MSAVPAAKITEALRASGKVSVILWITSATDYHGSPGAPRHLFDLGGLSQVRDLVIGQFSANVQVRLRHSQKNDAAGRPFLNTSGNPLWGRTSQIVFTFDGAQEVLYVNGHIERMGGATAGADLSLFVDDTVLTLGNRSTRHREWHGIMHVAALYDRALDHAEVYANYLAGPEAVLANSDSHRLSAAHRN